MNVRLTSEAEVQAETCDAWWRENRDVRDFFACELRDTKARLVCEGSAEDDEIIVHAVWGASKEHGPRL